jgi:hypothetical protein
MGERIIRPGIRSSDRTAALIRSKGGWMAQVFYDWLLTAVDDYGRYDARPAILRTVVFPLLLDLVRETDVQRCLAACEKAGLIRLYVIEGKPLLELFDFRQRLRAKKSKWPAPTTARNCHDNVMTMPTETETETETETDTDICRFSEFWAAYPKCLRKVDKPKCQALWKAKHLNPHTDRILQTLAIFKASDDWTKENGKFIPMTMSWLNKSPWLTDIEDIRPQSESSDLESYVPITDEQRAVALQEDET